MYHLTMLFTIRIHARFHHLHYCNHVSDYNVQSGLEILKQLYMNQL